MKIHYQLKPFAKREHYQLDPFENYQLARHYQLTLLKLSISETLSIKPFLLSIKFIIN